MDEYLDVEIKDLEISSGDTLATDLTTEMTEETMPQEETQALTTIDTPDVAQENVSSGNLHIMIIVVSICAVIGLGLGIWRGIKASRK